MKPLQQKIHNYFTDHSNGVVNLTESNCNDLIDMVLSSHHKSNTAVANMHRYNAQLDKYDFVVSRFTTDTEIKNAVIEALNEPPQMKFNRWDCYNSAGEFEGSIFTISCHLF